MLVAACFPGGVSAQGEGDTLHSGDGRSDRSVRIKIDDSGIRVEGSVEDGDTLKGRRIIFDSRSGAGEDRHYREKGADIVRFGEDVDVAHDEIVRGDVVVLGGNVTVEGKVVGDVVVIGGDAHAVSGAEINGDVVVIGGTLEEEPEVLIHGESVEMKDLSLGINGFSQFFGPRTKLLGLFVVPVQFFVSVLLSLLIVLFLRNRVITMQDHIQRAFFKNFGAGFLICLIGMFVVSFLMVVLVITLIGIPLALVLLVSCVALFIIARTAFVYALGVRVNDALKLQTANPFAVVVVGTAALYLPALLGFAISLLPFGDPVSTLFRLIGILASIFGYLVGLGAFFLSRFGSRTAGPPAGVVARPLAE
jgi:hypothetical protein